MVRLHRCDYAKPREPRDIRGQQVLSVLDSEPAVARAVLASNLFKIIQHYIVGPVADGVNRALEARPVGGFDIALEEAFWNIVVRSKACGFGRVVKGFEEK